MIQALKEKWRQFKRGKPGERFQERYLRKQASRGTPHRWVMIVAGALLLVIGLILIPAPGPGALILVAGVALIAQESLPVAVVLDKAELRLRHVLEPGIALWAATSTAVKAALVIAGLLILAALGLGTWQLLLTDDA